MFPTFHWNISDEESEDSAERMKVVGEKSTRVLKLLEDEQGLIRKILGRKTNCPDEDFTRPFLNCSSST